MAAKVNAKILMAKKHAVFAPMVILAPWFFTAPSLPRIVLIMLLIPYYFLCFMGPVYLMRYFIQVMGVGQKAVDLLFGFGLVLEYSLFVHGFFEVFAYGSMSAESALFLVPLRVFSRTVLAMAMLLMLCGVVGYGKELPED